MSAVSRETLLPFLPQDADPGLLDRYADILATDGVTQGLIGPREAPRLWERHLLNCALVVVPSPGLVPAGSSVADVGSGAGLPGLVWALVRPDLRVVLIEPLLRRATFLERAVDDLGLTGRAVVARDRAEQLNGTLAVDVVTARAVAPLDRLARWTLPLVRPGGALLALKGRSAAEEIARTGSALGELGAEPAELVTVGAGVVPEPTRVVIVRRRRQHQG
jgi:16S rRNA (guanine527-N7)-methyltransferase